MNRLSASIGLAAFLLAPPASAGALRLETATINAWTAYVRDADRRMQPRVEGRVPFLWSDETPGFRERLRAGEVVIAPVVNRGTVRVPNGLIHDWVGAVFIPNAKLEHLFAVVHDYDRYKDIYRPAVADSKVLACTDADQSFSMVWQRKILFVNAAIQAQYQAHDFVDGSRGYNIADSTRVREIQDYGAPDERFLPDGEGNGFLWRIHSIARYEERDGGVYLELEAIALTRDIPASLRWMVNPVVNRLSVGSLTTTLTQTRDAVVSVAARPEHVASCGARHRDSAARPATAY